MVDFFIKNYQWMFSGVGVVALTLFIKVFFDRKEKGKREIANTDSSNNSDNKIIISERNNASFNSLSNPVQKNYYPKEEKSVDPDVVDFSPQDIYKQIEETTPYQKEEVRKSYKGLKINWTLELMSIFGKNGNIVTVLFSSKDDSYTSRTISSKIDIEKYPFLKVSKEKDKFNILGKILKVDGLSIEVESENIKKLGNFPKH